MTRVLIVDDEPDILLMLRVNLEADGFETALAADGETALRRIADDRFDLMLLDVMMPVMDGWGVLEALPRITYPPRVIVVSAKSSDRDVTRAIELGAVDYLTKPFSPARLATLVQEVVALSPEQLEAHRRARLERISPAV
ncbi:MAG TPA: response regulator [Acidimicrobiales bacterium]|nr:response regulator [Acidimicrobiales bacterium]